MKKIIQQLKELHPLTYVVWGIIILFIYSVIFGACEYKRGWRDCENSTKVDTIEKTVIRYDTVEIDKPVPVNQYIVKYKTDTFPIIKHDTVDNTAVVQVPITQAKYHEDSLYTAWVSGYKPKLDSINIYQKTVTHTTTITKTVTDKRKWAIGLHGGYGYGLKSKDFQPFVGVGISYRLF